MRALTIAAALSGCVAVNPFYSFNHPHAASAAGLVESLRNQGRYSRESRRDPALPAATAAAPRAPYCQPSDPCWPSSKAWSALNATVGGALIAIAPEGFPCTNPASTECSWVVGNWTDPLWRRAQPGAMQNPNWEANLTSGAACYNVGEPCSQGSIPTVGVAAHSPADVSAALAFAAAHNIKIVVKASGHDYQGRSTSAGALLVWLHEMAAIAVDEAFAPCPGDKPRAAVNVQPGAGYGDVYAELARGGKWAVVGGSARTVSASGGHLLGGGHSFMSPSYGLAADNVLAFTAVLADGSALTASPCANADLFWALRGGGGGTFAVVTSTTHALHPVQPVIGLTLTALFLKGTPSAALWLDGLLSLTPAYYNATLLGGVWSGYWGVYPTGSAQAPLVYSGSLVFTGSAGEAEASIAPLLQLAKANPADVLVVNATFAPFASFNAWHDSMDSPESGDRTGSWLSLGSRLLPLDTCTDAALRVNASIALAEIAPIGIEGFMVVPANTPDPGSAATSVTPAWRSAALHVVFGVGWASTAPPAQVAGNLTSIHEITEYLSAQLPTSSGAYWNEADVLQDDWQATFWGPANYGRLQGVKAKVDPTGAFSCWHCVELPA